MLTLYRVKKHCVQEICQVITSILEALLFFPLLFIYSLKKVLGPERERVQAGKAYMLLTWV